MNFGDYMVQQFLIGAPRRILMCDQVFTILCSLIAIENNLSIKIKFKKNYFISGQRTII